MKTNPVKQKLLRGEATFGTWLSLGNLFAARILARMGWDWLTLDLEHSPVDLDQAAAIFGAVADRMKRGHCTLHWQIRMSPFSPPKSENES